MGLTKKRTHDEFVKNVYELEGDQYTVIGMYVNANTHILMKHNLCNKIYEVTPSRFLQGRRCVHCFQNKKKTTEQFKQEVYLLVGNEYTVLGEYKNNRERIEIIHNECGFIYKYKPKEFLHNNRRCPKCNGTYRRTHEEFILELKKVHGDEYVLLSKYERMNKKVLIKHSKCGYQWEALPSNILKGHGCPKCGHSIRLTPEEFLVKFNEASNGEYILLSTYEKHDVKIKVRHEMCKYEYMVKPHNFLSGFRCPKCSKSKGEKRIYDLLNKLNVNFQIEFTFDDCKHIKRLPFDFAIFNELNELLGLIEFDGKQHYEPIEWFGGEEGFELTKQRDEIKNKYCQENSINLLRIPYWECDNIEYLIEGYLDNLN